MATSTTGDAGKTALTVHPNAIVKVTNTEAAETEANAYTLACAEAAVHITGPLTRGSAYIVVIKDESFSVYTLNVFA